MAGPIQKAISEGISTVSAVTTLGKKLNENEKQISQEESAKVEAEAKAERDLQKEAKDTALQADLIRMGADPDSAEAFMTARALGLDTSKFGRIRKQGKFVGTYSSLAEKLSKDALTDSLSSRVINDRGFAERIVALGGSRRGRVDALVKASEGGKKNEQR